MISQDQFAFDQLDFDVQLRDAIGEVAYGNIDTSFGSSGRVWFPGKDYGFDARRVFNIRPERECQTSHFSTPLATPGSSFAKSIVAADRAGPRGRAPLNCLTRGRK